MVTQKEITASNALINDATAPHVAVFVGGTSGIGQLTLKALVTTSASQRIYLIGRPSSADRSKTFIESQRAINPKADIVWVEAEVSLLSDARRACDLIKSRETHVDLLFLTTGYAPFGGREETSEGVELSMSLAYYTRVLFTLHLLPLLKAAPAGGRVVSVLGGGLERGTGINLDDIDMKTPGNFGAIKAQTQNVELTTVVLDKLAAENPEVTFIHSWPGWVNTGNVNRGVDPSSAWGWFVWLFLGPLIRLVSISDEVSAQRHLFQSTSAYFGGGGSTVPWAGELGLNALEEPAGAVVLVNYKGKCTPNPKVVRLLREKAQKKVWEHTMKVLGPYLQS